MRVRSPAKINLDLHVGPPREDGFHPIRSWMVTVDLCDTLTFAPADRLSLTCDEPSIPADSRNLVWRAAELIGSGRGVAIHLEKQIPAGGGLGGGSSNAATTLMALNKLWQLGHDVKALSEMAATLGSDVPFFLHGPSSICTGRGDIVTPVPPPAAKWAILLLPGIAMPTPAVYRRLDELRESVSTAESVEHRPVAGDFANDLEAPAFDLSPELAGIRKSAEFTIGQPVRMSGSGSTLFGLFDDENPARVAAAKLSGIDVRIVRLAVG